MRALESVECGESLPWFDKVVPLGTSLKGQFIYIAWELIKINVLLMERLMVDIGGWG